MSSRAASSTSFLTGWKRLLIVLLAVPAILVGLVAMHFLSTSNAAHPADGHGVSHISVASTDVGADANLVSHPAELSGCDGMCGTEHDMLGMACVLALLFTSLILAVHRTLLRWDSLAHGARAILARVSALAPPEPPSLLVLSISRT